MFYSISSVILVHFVVFLSNPVYVYMMYLCILDGVQSKTAWHNIAVFRPYLQDKVENYVKKGYNANWIQSSSIFVFKKIFSYPLNFANRSSDVSGCLYILFTVQYTFSVELSGFLALKVFYGTFYCSSASPWTYYSSLSLVGNQNPCTAYV